MGIWWRIWKGKSVLRLVRFVDMEMNVAYIDPAEVSSIYEMPPCVFSDGMVCPSRTGIRTRGGSVVLVTHGADDVYRQLTEQTP